jgi:4-hydroxybenzoate polyprenyltransferase
MPGVFSRKLLPLLQLTRLALVFTAIADALCEMFLQARQTAGPDGDLRPYMQPLRIGLIVVISSCLYAFGMSLNDIVDRRRDETLAATRPLPSGRIGVWTAHLVCFLLAIASLGAGALYANLYRDGWMSFLLLAWTGALITFYDFAGKYLVAPGLLTLGLIRFFHCLIPAPHVPLLWHPLFLFNHITIISTIAYAWEQKRPALTRAHINGVLAGLATVNILTVWLTLRQSPGQIPANLTTMPFLLIPLVAAQLFVLLAIVVRWKFPTPAVAGRTLMLYGLLWLIVYDAAFTLAYVGPWPAAIILALLPVAYLAVHLMRAWSNLMALARRPQFQRAQG